jgi:hypothetical protein
MIDSESNGFAARMWRTRTVVARAKREEGDGVVPAESARRGRPSMFVEEASMELGGCGSPEGGGRRASEASPRSLHFRAGAVGGAASGAPRLRSRSNEPLVALVSGGRSIQSAARVSGVEHEVP